MSVCFYLLLSVPIFSLSLLFCSNLRRRRESPGPRPRHHHGREGRRTRRRRRSGRGGKRERVRAELGQGGGLLDLPRAAEAEAAPVPAVDARKPLRPPLLLMVLLPPRERQPGSQRNAGTGCDLDRAAERPEEASARWVRRRRPRRRRRRQRQHHRRRRRRRRRPPLLPLPPPQLFLLFKLPPAL